MSQTRAFIEFRTNILRPTDFSQFDNVSGAGREIIPNYVHYIRLQQPEIRWDGTKELCHTLRPSLRSRFFEAACMKSAFMVQRPEKLFIHTDTELRGEYWEQLLEIPGFRAALVIRSVTAPARIFGVEFYWTAHRADVLRLLVLRRYGGIYLGTNTYTLSFGYFFSLLS